MIFQYYNRFFCSLKNILTEQLNYLLDSFWYFNPKKNNTLSISSRENHISRIELQMGKKVNYRVASLTKKGGNDITQGK